MSERIVAAIRRARVVPVVRTPTADQAHAEVSRLLDDGVGVVELTATVPGWQEVLAAVRAAAPDLVLGLGTVTTAADAEMAAAGGADFLVTPFPVPGVRSAAGPVPVVEGGFSPGEVAAAAAYGLCKLFPAHLGGPTYLRSLLAVLPGAQVMPTGGIAPEAVDDWLAAGAVAVGIGSERLRATG
jgi:2-dehydro-3-deoxyphosphogluconate aldolase/(4S)-4-hydroxy-2-oxoglutarate aldolase